MATTATTTDSAYRSEGLVDALADTMRAHRSVGDDFPEARAALVSNLKILQSALPAAIAEVENAMRDVDART